MKKGFTLIELLAVILILGIIALIAIPTVTNIIEEARRGAFEASVKNVLKLANEKYTIESMKNNESAYSNFEFNNNKGGLDYKGSNFNSGNIEVNSDGSIAINISDGRYCANGSSENLVITKGSCDPALTEPEGEYVGKPVYFNPEDGLICTKNEAIVQSGSKNGCLKFYILKLGEDTVDLLLAHNITERVKWNENSNYDDPNVVLPQLEIDTASWQDSLDIRLPDIRDIAKVVNAEEEIGWEYEGGWWGEESIFYFEGAKNGNWNEPISGQGTSSYAWLYDYLYGCTSYGCNYNGVNLDAPGSNVPGVGVTVVEGSGYAYWTSNLAPEEPSLAHMAWVVDRTGCVNGVTKSYAGAGIRPVITVNKNILK